MLFSVRQLALKGRDAMPYLLPRGCASPFRMCLSSGYLAPWGARSEGPRWRRGRSRCGFVPDVSVLRAWPGPIITGFAVAGGAGAVAVAIRVFLPTLGRIAAFDKTS